jgi:hypothetical protein
MSRRGILPPEFKSRYVSNIYDISTPHRLPQNFLNSIEPNMRRANSTLESTILGYDEKISTEMCAFIETLTDHYDTTQIGQRFTEMNDELWQEFKGVLVINARIHVEDRALFQIIINSSTFKALIFCFINHYMIPGPHAQKKASLKKFYKLIKKYFIEQNGCLDLVFMEKELKYEAQGKIYYKSYIPLIKIIMKINICSITAFEKIRARCQSQPAQKIDQGRLFAMFQETIAAKSFDIASELTCSYVCNLPGCGDYISFFKGIKKYVLFTECKLREDRATAALIDLDGKAGVNVKYQEGNVQRLGLIGKANTTIKGRFLASYIDSYSTYSESGKNIHEFTLGILELSTKKSIRKIEMMVLITDEILRDLDIFVSAQSADSDQFERKFNLRSTFPPRRPRKVITNNIFDPEYGEVPIVNLSIPPQFHLSRMLDIWLTTMDIDKAYSGITTTLPISNNKSLTKLRLKRFKKVFLEPKTSSIRDSLCRWAAVAEDEQSLEDLFCLMKRESKLTENERNKMKKKINKIFVEYAGDPEYFEQPMQGENNNSKNFVVAPAFPLETDPARRHINGYQTFEKRRGYVVRYHPRIKKYFYIAKPKPGFKLMFDITLMEFVHVPENFSRSDLKSPFAKSIPQIFPIWSDSGERIFPPNTENGESVSNDDQAGPGAASNSKKSKSGKPIGRILYNR